MTNLRWPGGYKATSKLAQKLFEEKAKWHRKHARMSFTRKVAALDRMFELERQNSLKSRHDK